MFALRIRVSRVIDLGPTVAIVGAELNSNRAVTLSIDYRPVQKLRDGWAAAGLSELVNFSAEDLIMRLDLDATDSPDGGVALPTANAA